MRVQIDEGSVRIELAPWEKALGLMKDITIPRAQLGEVRVVEDPIKEAMASGMKAGLRLPWLSYIARTIRLDQAFIVRRGVPGLSLEIHGHGPLRRVLVSTPDAQELSDRLRGRDQAS
jgi:hypothetical protein